MEAPNSKILVIDDDKLNFLLIEKAFKNLEVIYASSGTEGLDKIREAKPGLVLLDVMLGDGSGFDFLKSIRKQFDAFSLPVIMVTSKDGDNDIEKGFSDGANDYLIKPFSIVVAKARIETQLRLELLHYMYIKQGEQQMAESVVTTYNHEINNPLTILNAYIAKIKNKYPGDADVEKVENQVVRISKMIKVIQASVNEGAEQELYAGSSKMIKRKFG